MAHSVTRYAKLVSLLVSTLAVAACDIGDGNKIESISIDETVTTVRLDDCFGSRMTAIATFTDGTQVNFTDRVNWTSDNPDAISITTRPTDRPAEFDEDFGFIVAGDTAVEGDTANISIEYFGLTAEAPLTVTATGQIEELGLSIHNATMAKGTRQEVNVWGRTSDDLRLDLTGLSTFEVDNTDFVTLDEEFSSGVTATEISTAPVTLTATYCGQTATATINVVEDAPISMELNAEDTTLTSGTFTDITATALYTGGGFQSRRTSTRFSQTTPGDPEELNFTDSFNLASTLGNFRVRPAATSGTHEVTGQYVDLEGNDVAGATGTIDFNLVRTQLQSPAYRLDRGLNILTNTNVDLAIIGLFDLLNEDGSDTGNDFEQDMTDFSTLSIDAEDVSKVVIGSGVAAGITAGETEVVVNSVADGFTEDETFTIITHDDTGVTVNGIEISTVKTAHKTYRMRAVANVTTAAGATFDQDVSLNISWETSDPDVFHIDNSGADIFSNATGGDAGCATVTGYFRGQTSSLAINSETGDNTGCAAG